MEGREARVTTPQERARNLSVIASEAKQSSSAPAGAQKKALGLP
jgi:hypothetical protein